MIPTTVFLPKVDDVSYRAVVVILTNAEYYPRALNTIRDIRSMGQWHSDLVVIPINFDIPNEIVEQYDLQIKRFDRIDLSDMLIGIGPDGFVGTDRRELVKLVQWEKIHVFDEWFAQWDRVIYFDAGFRVVDRVDYLLEADCTGCIIAPNDAGFPDGDRGPKTDSRFGRLVYDHASADLIDQIKEDLGEDCMTQEYFCNCLWVYDTAILQYANVKDELVKMANKYPVWVSNEMSVMNAVLNVKWKIWREMESRNHAGKYMYAWTEQTLQTHPTTYRDYCYIKYASTI
jgi:hypothetical protein